MGGVSTTPVPLSYTHKPTQQGAFKLFKPSKAADKQLSERNVQQNKQIKTGKEKTELTYQVNL